MNPHILQLHAQEVTHAQRSGRAIQLVLREGLLVHLRSAEGQHHLERGKRGGHAGHPCHAGGTDELSQAQDPRLERNIGKWQHRASAQEREGQRRLQRRRRQRRIGVGCGMLTHGMRFLLLGTARAFAPCRGGQTLPRHPLRLHMRRLPVSSRGMLLREVLELGLQAAGLQRLLTPYHRTLTERSITSLDP